MRTPDAPRTCQHPCPDKPSGVCGVPLSRRGRSKWCPQHSRAKVQETRKSRNPQWQKAWRQKHPHVYLKRKQLYKVAGNIQKDIQELCDRFRINFSKSPKFMRGPLLDALRPLYDPGAALRTKFIFYTITLGRFRTFAFCDADEVKDDLWLMKLRHCLFSEEYDKRILAQPPALLEVVGVTPKNIRTVMREFDDRSPYLEEISRYADLLIKSGWDGKGWGLAISMPIPQPPGLGGKQLQMMNLQWGRWFDGRRAKGEPGVEAYKEVGPRVQPIPLEAAFRTHDRGLK